MRLMDFNGDLTSASATSVGLEFAYHSGARAFALLERPARRVEIDGVPCRPETTGNVLLLPRGQHIVTVE